MARKRDFFDTPADDQSMSLGQRAGALGEGLSKGENVDTPLWGPTGKRRDNQGSQTPTGVYNGFYTDGDGGESPIGDRWNPLADENLVSSKTLLSGDYKAPTKAQRIAAMASGGINAKPYDGSKYQGGEPAEDTRKQTAQGSIKETPAWLRRRSG